MYISVASPRAPGTTGALCRVLTAVASAGHLDAASAASLTSPGLGRIRGAARGVSESHREGITCADVLDQIRHVLVAAVPRPLLTLAVTATAQAAHPQSARPAAPPPTAAPPGAALRQPRGQRRRPARGGRLRRRGQLPLRTGPRAAGWPPGRASTWTRPRCAWPRRGPGSARQRDAPTASRCGSADAGDALSFLVAATSPRRPGRCRDRHRHRALPGRLHAARTRSPRPTGAAARSPPRPSRCPTSTPARAASSRRRPGCTR